MNIAQRIITGAVVVGGFVWLGNIVLNSGMGKKEESTISIPINECRTIQGLNFCYKGLGNDDKTIKLSAQGYTSFVPTEGYIPFTLSGLEVERATSDTLVLRYFGDFMVDEKDLKCHTQN